MDEKFNYVVGRPWHPEDPNSSIAAYMYGGQVHFGDLAEAEAFREYCNGTLKAPERYQNGYRIYKLVEISK